MIKVIHRVNKIEQLKSVPKRYGVEVDVRAQDNKLILSHEPFEGGDELKEYLAAFNHAFIILEIKEEGIEKAVIKLCKSYDIENYFLLNVSFPFTYLLSKKGIRKMALRYSEFESIKTCLSMAGRVDWVWADTFTCNPLNRKSYELLKAAGFKICLVCPERWGREHDIETRGAAIIWDVLIKIWTQHSELFLWGIGLMILAFLTLRISKV